MGRISRDDGGMLSAGFCSNFIQRGCQMAANSVGLAVPILPGKTEEWRRFTEELNGPRRTEWEESRRRVGIQREASYLNETPQGHLVVVYFDTEGPLEEIFQRLGTSQEPFDIWFRQKAKEIHGFDLEQPPPGPLPQLGFDMRLK